MSTQDAAATLAEREQAMIAACPLRYDLYPIQLRDMTLEAVRLCAAAEPEPTGEEPRTGDSVAAKTDPPPAAPKLLGLFGFPQTGKDVSADYAQDNYDGVHRFAFSDAMIIEANQYMAPFGHVITLANKNAPHYRQLLQAFGMGRRIEDPDYWNNAIRDRVARLQADPAVKMIIITGGRIPEDPETGELNVRDLELIKDLGGQVWKVNRPGNTYTAAAEHPVERGLGKLPESAFDQIVLNVVEGDFAAYQENIEALMNGRPQPWTEPMTAEQAAEVRAQRQARSSALNELTRMSEELPGGYR